MVDESPHWRQWQAHSIIHPLPTMVIESDTCNLGWCLLRQPSNGGTVVCLGDRSPHQCQGATSGVPCPQDVCQRQGGYTHSSENGQHYSSLFHSKILMDTISKMWGLCMERKIYILAKHLPCVWAHAGSRPPQPKPKYSSVWNVDRLLD